jgi:hypothetical protein
VKSFLVHDFNSLGKRRNRTAAATPPSQLSSLSYLSSMATPPPVIPTQRYILCNKYTFLLNLLVPHLQGRTTPQMVSVKLSSAGKPR